MYTKCNIWYIKHFEEIWKHFKLNVFPIIIIILGTTFVLLVRNILRQYFTADRCSADGQRQQQQPLAAILIFSTTLQPQVLSAYLFCVCISNQRPRKSPTAVTAAAPAATGALTEENATRRQYYTKFPI